MRSGGVINSKIEAGFESSDRESTHPLPSPNRKSQLVSLRLTPSGPSAFRSNELPPTVNMLGPRFAKKSESMVSSQCQGRGSIRAAISQESRDS